MIDTRHISPMIHFLTDYDLIISFDLHRKRCEEKPKVDDEKIIIKGICINYAFCGEQDYGIEPLATAFDATNDDMVIGKIPKELELAEEKEITILRFGRNMKVDEEVKRMTDKAGVIGFWDSKSFAICSTKEYKGLLDAAFVMFKPKKTRFAFGESFSGRNLLIMNI